MAQPTARKNASVPSIARKTATAGLALALTFSAAMAAGTNNPSDRLVLKPGTFKDLPGWDKDRQGEAVEAFSRSCKRILAADPKAAMGGKKNVAGTYGDWQEACKALGNVDPKNDEAVRAFFEKYFQPWLATKNGTDEKGLFTGYYEAVLEGSRTRTERFKYPVHANPTGAKSLKKAWTREQISEGKWPHNEKVIVWVDDPIALYFMHIQGSGRVHLPDGTFVRVEYDGQNGYPYRAIGNELIKRGIMEKKDVTLQSIRKWLADNPAKAKEIIYSDKSFVFFREVDRNAGPVGGEGAVLTPGRSLAVDHTRVPYGLPIWLDVAPPVEGTPKIQRLVMGQDTGGAIRGPVRGDKFWGSGKHAEDMAGKMKSEGRYWFLLPKGVMPK